MPDAMNSSGWYDGCRVSMKTSPMWQERYSSATASRSVEHADVLEDVAPRRTAPGSSPRRRRRSPRARRSAPSRAAATAGRARTRCGSSTGARRRRSARARSGRGRCGRVEALGVDRGHERDGGVAGARQESASAGVLTTPGKPKRGRLLDQRGHRPSGLEIGLPVLDEDELRARPLEAIERVNARPGGRECAGPTAAPCCAGGQHGSARQRRERRADPPRDGRRRGGIARVATAEAALDAVDAAGRGRRSGGSCGSRPAARSSNAG